MTTEDTPTEEYIIDTKSVQDSFEKELKQYDGSARIFFSGKYGVGKTKFLERFFEEKKEEYLKIHLYPVNYQIYNNLDIIELLKADIIIELLKLKQNILFADNSKLTLVKYLKQYATPSLIAEKIVDYGTDISKTISSVIPVGIFSILGKALKDYQAVNNHFQDIKSGDSGIIEKFLKDSKEPDIISSIVHTTIKDINDKKSVLIIDDLDRLDPEHIFRILNILSAHFDRDGDNKFGFDYIIIVGDYHNIQSIFHHKYGKDADFDGYIDKFYTVKPFEFDNRKALLEELPNIIKQSQREDVPKSNLDHSYFIIQDIIQKTISLDIINLRRLLKHIKIKLVPVKDKIPNIPRESSHLYISTDILLDMFETKDSLIARIQKIKENKTLSNTYYFTDKCKKISYKLYEAIIDKSIIDNTKYEYIYKNTKYNLISDGDDSITIKQGNPEQDINLYYDLLINFITNKFDKL